MKEIVLEGRLLARKENAHEYLKEVMHFPEYYGKNLDALHECLTDLADTDIVIMVPEEMDEYLKRVLRVFKAAEKENQNLKIRMIQERE